jgi:hypothetical protein
MQNILKISLAFLLMGSIAYAQKLPKVQASGVWAPANIKIDGKTTEWDDQFQAHNQPNHIYYTLSNDDNNLYLTARMDDIAGGKKILKGGITFTIIPLSKKTSSLSVTFPVFKKRGELEGHNPLFLYGILKEDTIKNKAKIDTLIATSNRDIPKIYKEIHITGIPEITDPFQSVYNTLGIRVGASFDKKMRYTYELAIPLKYLEGAISDVKSIRYNIKLNVEPIIPMKPSAQPINIVVLQPVSSPRPLSMNDMFNFEDSDFSGVYTLAKKP